MTRFYSHQRSVLFRFLERIELVSTSPDTSTIDAIAFLLAHKADRHEWISVVRDESREDGSAEQVPLVGLSMITEKWWPVVTGSKTPSVPATRVLRRPFEMCVLTEVMQDLRSGDLCIPGSDRYSDYRGQLVTDEEYRKGLASYGERAGLRGARRDERRGAGTSKRRIAIRPPRHDLQQPLTTLLTLGGPRHQTTP